MVSFTVRSIFKKKKYFQCEMPVVLRSTLTPLTKSKRSMAFVLNVLYAPFLWSDLMNTLMIFFVVQISVMQISVGTAFNEQKIKSFAIPCVPSSSLLLQQVLYQSDVLKTFKERRHFFPFKYLHAIERRTNIYSFLRQAK